MGDDNYPFDWMAYHAALHNKRIELNGPVFHIPTGRRGHIVKAEKKGIYIKWEWEAAISGPHDPAAGFEYPAG